VVEEHILRGEPVSSKRVARISKLRLSAASIRGIMARLEDEGWLVQPHTSAGRVPTDRGYRLYVDQMLEQRPRLAPSEAREIEDALARRQGEIPDLLGEASRQLSVISHQVGVVLAPEVRRLLVERLEFVRLDARRVATLIVGRSGVVHHRIVAVPEPLDAPELERIGRYLSQQFAGRSLPEMRDELVRRMRADREAFDRLQACSLELCGRALEADLEETLVFVDGASNLLESPEFSDRDVIRALFKTLEEKQTLIGLLGRLIDGEGVRVVIGEENPLADLACCSVVASPYRSGARTIGTVGIVGPTRMPYERVIPLVDFLARTLSGYLSNLRN